MTEEPKPWEEEFEKIMPINWSDHGVSRIAIKQFISDLLSSHTKSIISSLVEAGENVEKKTTNEYIDIGFNAGRERVLRVIESKAKELLGE